MDAKLTSRQGDALFGGLCVELGFCLGQDEIARLLEDQPEDIYSFTNAIFFAARVNPERVERHVWWQVRQRVAAAFGPEAQPSSPQPSIL
jgi:hypothetical protein